MTSQPPWQPEPAAHEPAPPPVPECYLALHPRLRAASVLSAWNEGRFDVAVHDALREVSAAGGHLDDGRGGKAFGAARALEALLQADRLLRALEP